MRTGLVARIVVGSVANNAAPSYGTISRSRFETSSKSCWSLVAFAHTSESSPNRRWLVAADLAVTDTTPPTGVPAGGPV